MGCGCPQGTPAQRSGERTVKYSLVRSDPAERDLLEIGRYIARDSVDAALRFLDRVDVALRTIERFPGVGQVRAEISEGVRSFPLGQYLLLYRVIDSEIQLLRVVHGARDIRRLDID